MNYDAQKMPLGSLTKATITQGYSLLKRLSELIDDNDLAGERYALSYMDAIRHLTDRYYMMVPRAFGKSGIPPINSSGKIRKEVEMLDSLTAMKFADRVMTGSDSDSHPDDRLFESLNMEEMTVLEPESIEYQLLEEYLMTSTGDTHAMEYDVESIFRIERRGEADRFSTSRFSSLEGNRKLLWHGSRSTNFPGILCNGLRIAPPEAPKNGYMFDKVRALQKTLDIWTLMRRQLSGHLPRRHVFQIRAVLSS